MNDMDLDSNFAGAVRAELNAIGTKQSRLQRHRRRTRSLGAGILAIAAAGAITGAAIVVNNLPGTTTVTPVGSAVTVTRTGDASIDLGTASSGANTVVLDVTCVSDSGKISIPLTPGVMKDASGKPLPSGPETVEWDCAKTRTTTHINDGYLAPGSTSITITASPGTTWTAAARYGSATTSDWGVNANGQTYGADNKKNGMPDLQAAQATNGNVGYIYTKELLAFVGDGYLNVYESDGTTVIGKFPIGNVDGGLRESTTDVPSDPAGG
jgi:hypothetical protein